MEFCRCMPFTLGVENRHLLRWHFSWIFVIYITVIQLVKAELECCFHILFALTLHLPT